MLYKILSAGGLENCYNCSLAHLGNIWSSFCQGRGTFVSLYYINNGRLRFLKTVSDLQVTGVACGALGLPDDLLPLWRAGLYPKTSKVNDFWHPNDEGGMAWNDPEIGIRWPKLVGNYKGTPSAEGYTLEDGTPLNLSEKDQKWLGLKDTFKF